MFDGELIAGHYTALFAEYRAAVRGFVVTVERLAERERIGLRSEDAVIGLPRGCDVREAIATAAKAIGERLVEHAARHFAPAGAHRLAIPARDFEAHWEDDAGEQLQPERLWAELEARYGGTRGQHAGYAQAAALIIGSFDLQADSELKRIGRTAVLNLSVSTEDDDYGGGRHLCYRSSEALKALLTSLNVFLQWADSPPMTLAARGWNSSVRSRERIVVAPQALELRTYYERYEFRLGEAFVEKLQVFLGLHGRAAWTRRR